MKRFWSKVKMAGPDECWEWTAATFKTGRGSFWLEGKNVSAHRTAYKLHYGVSPADKQVCHRCDNPLCCNPRHLFLGTGKDNQQDSITKGRKARFKGENNPRSKITEEQVVAIRKDQRSNKKIAKEYGLSFQHVGAIKRNLTWKHTGESK